jgi:type III restriction enzyme
MRFQFEPDLPHQEAAIEAVCDLFVGQEVNTTAFTIAPGEIAGQLALAEKTVGYGNRLTLLEDEILGNLNAVQDRAALPRDAALRSMDFTIEMETGTGKTYVYLRSIFELNKRFGFTKFVIVVPSVAIREGVKKSIEQMRDHFRALYDGVPFDSFVYDSADLSRVRDFASAATIRVMIVTIQSINSANNVFYDGREQTGDIPAVDLVAETRPVLIVDEPQSVDGGLKGAGRTALEKMKPLATLRYSATHVDKHHQIYRLDAFDAHDRELVKSIEVDGAKIEDAHSAPYVRLIRVETRPGHLPRARLEIALQGAGSVRRDEVWANEDDRLTDLSNGRTVYDGIWIGEVSKVGGLDTVQLMLPGDVKIMGAGESHGDVDPQAMARAMLARTIKHHLDKERKLRPLGIKVLSLFFLNRVADYRLYDDAGNASPGPFATMFEEEYRKAASKPEYATLFAGTPLDPGTAHGGYFSADKRGKFTEPTLNAAGELSNASSRDDAARTFDLIMKDKERLLGEVTPLRFLFSHSALREGWDNPNVFQVCVLRAMGGERQRRQSLGRGLRLCVDQTGQRRRDEGLNVLTVVSDETFATYADGLQAEMERDLGVRLGFVEQDMFAGLIYPTAEGPKLVSVNESRAIYVALRAADMVDNRGHVTDTLRVALKDGTVPLPPTLADAAAKLIRERLTRLARKLKVSDANKTGSVKLNLDVLNGHDFQALWNRINIKTTYRLKFDDADLIKVCARALADMPAPGEARVTFETAELLVGREGVSAERTATSVPRRLAAAKLAVPDLLGELQNRTDLPRHVLAHILLDSGRIDEAATNPAAFVDACVTIINAGKRLVLVEGITYRELPERWSQELFAAEDGISIDRIVEVGKSPMSHVVFDSNIERDLAIDMDDSDAVRVFAKLPKAFKVTTPLGTYNPDWAVARETEAGHQVYLVTESKGDLLNLRDAEKGQIKCGEAHFAALNVLFVEATNLAGVVSTL